MQDGITINGNELLHKFVMGRSFKCYPEYNKSWDMIMRVWDKFKNLNVHSNYYLDFKKIKESFGNSILHSDKASAFNEAITAVLWYINTL
jgi:hypothetical protein